MSSLASSGWSQADEDYDDYDVEVDVVEDCDNDEEMEIEADDDDDEIYNTNTWRAISATPAGSEASEASRKPYRARIEA